MRLAVAEDLEWMLQARCRYIDPDLFYPVTEDQDAPQVREAKAVCKPCPVQLDCLDYVISIESLESSDYARHGIWAGMTSRERGQLYRAMRRCLPDRVKRIAITTADAEVRGWAAREHLPLPANNVVSMRLRLMYAQAVLAAEGASA